MTEDKAQVKRIAPLKSITVLMATVERVMNRAPGLPGMATFHGPSGYGKTYAARYVAARHNGCYVQVRSVWTRKKLCRAILATLGVQPARDMADMVDQIGQELALSGRPLLIDEADYLVQRRMVEIVRDLYEASGAAIVLIGEEHLPGKLKVWERVHGRMMDWGAAPPACLGDARHLSPIYCPGIAIAADLLARVHEASGGSVRRLGVNLDRVRELARTEGVDAISLEDWGSRAFFRGSAPAARRAAA